MSNEGMTDIDASSGPAGEAAEIGNVSSRDVAAAAEKVVTAAAEAKAREFKWKAQVAPNYEVQQVLEEVSGGPGFEWTSWTNAVDGTVWISAGNHKFVITDMMCTTAQEVREYGNDDPEQPWEGQYEWIGEKFEYFHERWSSFPLTMGQHCDEAKQSIQSGQMTAIVHTKNAVDKWQGKAQLGFVENFLDPYLINTLTNQQGLLDELAVAMYAYEGMLKQAAADAKSDADKAVEALDAMGEGGGSGFLSVLKIVGTVAGVVAAVGSVGTATPFMAGLGLLRAGIGVVETLTPEQDVPAAHVDELVDNLATRLDELRTQMDAEEQSIADALSDSVGLVTDCLGSESAAEVSTILPNEPNDDNVPNISDGNVPSPSDFHPS